MSQLEAEDPKALASLDWKKDAERVSWNDQH